MPSVKLILFSVLLSTHVYGQDVPACDRDAVPYDPTAATPPPSCGSDCAKYCSDKYQLPEGVQVLCTSPRTLVFHVSVTSWDSADKAEFNSDPDVGLPWEPNAPHSWSGNHAQLNTWWFPLRYVPGKKMEHYVSHARDKNETSELPGVRDSADVQIVCRPPAIHHLGFFPNLKPHRATPLFVLRPASERIVTRPAGVGGDPLCETLDGFEYTCNYLGEALYGECKQWRVHATTVKAGENGGATVLNKVALIQTSATDNTIADRVVISMAEGTAAAHPLVVRVNGKAVTKDTTTTATELTVTIGDVVTVTSLAGNIVTVRANVELKQLAMGAIFADSCKGNTRGLIGNYNGDPTDDLVTRHGDTIAHDSSEETIYTSMVLSYLITKAEDSIFPPEDFMAGNASYTPHMVNDADQETCKAMSGCPADEKHCCLEYVVGGDSFVQEYKKFKAGAQDDFCSFGCNNRGTCTDGECKCTAGWGGTRCNVFNCASADHCNNQGTCTDGKCKCTDNSGWSGTACDVFTTPKYQKYCDFNLGNCKKDKKCRKSKGWAQKKMCQTRCALNECPWNSKAPDCEVKRHRKICVQNCEAMDKNGLKDCKKHCAQCMGKKAGCGKKKGKGLDLLLCWRSCADSGGDCNEKGNCACL